ncbi:MULTISPECIES: hypothetical protein [unclassified Streptomyces]|uniref:hypothetical protein n=1 Tax=unclassified Streptomyces TaxID=2593676 RepID=UPI0004C39DB3
MNVTDTHDELQRQTAEAEARFAADSWGASMTVLRRDGGYRHLLFDLPQASWKGFELVTWPGTLVVRGGLGCWTFHRDGADMMETARTSDRAARVDPHFWEERLASGGGQTAKRYSPSRARALIRAAVAEHAESHPGLAAAAADELFSARAHAELGTEAGLRAALTRFHLRHEASRPSGRRPFRFPVDTWELNAYDPWFLVTCAALPWAAGQDDATTVPAVA